MNARRRWLRSRLVLGVLFCVLLGLSLPAGAHPPVPGGTKFADVECYYNPAGTVYSYWSRDDAYLVSNGHRGEGYHWGGGCIDLDGVDDSPGEPVQTESTHGEGTDCSGLVYKSWAISSSSSAAKKWWGYGNYLHGPFTANSYRSDTGAWATGFTKAGFAFMDVAVSTGHIALFWYRSTTGSDYFIESRAEAYGTNAWIEPYRGSSSYVRTVRRGWST